MDRPTQLAPLGRQRLILIDCLGGNTPGMPGFFDAGSDIEIFSAFRAYAVRLSLEWASESDPIAISLLAAARLLSGDIDAARTIIEHLPKQPYKLDHGAGACRVLPSNILHTALPLAPALRDSSRRPDKSALQHWLDTNRDRLWWNETDGVYQPLRTLNPA